ncbi:tyrosine-type recombinase/integrase [Jiangella muralis]|uniref:tyrosine-type recombinase/integrase n=1 Tax=Jiangella muralis TaxID=702383 RepID=UPI000A9E3124|nr:hypothetical protein [Jiangella muralis]
MGYAENVGDYYIGRYSAGGKWPTVKNSRGETIRYRTKRDASKAANDEEAKVRSGTWHDPERGRITFGAWANGWYASQNLALSTMQNYKHHLEEHLLPEFEDDPLAEIFGADVDEWERKELAARYSLTSVRTWRTTLSTILADAVVEGLIPANPAVKRRGRGKRAGRSRRRGPEKVTTDALGALLIAERAALLAGRDEEFVAITAMYWTGMRWGEVVGLRTEYARPSSIRIEHQLWEADDGAFHELPPKDDSYRDIDAPGFLSTLISAHLTRSNPRPCPCHGNRYVFSGRNGSAHWRRSPFGDWLFEPATSGWFPKKRATDERRPVPLASEPWPGRPLRGRNNQGRAEACWMPIATGLTPHGLRHSHKTLLVEMRVPEILSHERLGHELDGIGGRYSHVTRTMREELMASLTERWHAALVARRDMHPTSPVTILDELLFQSSGARTPGRSPGRPDHPTMQKTGALHTLRSKPRPARGVS